TVSTFSIASAPGGLSLSVDGSVYTTPHTFTCTAGSQHTLTVTSPQPAGFAGARYSFVGWSDGGVTLSRQITCPSSAITYQANFTPQYQLTTSVVPAGAGGISAIPSSSDGFYNGGGAVQLTASPGLVSWSGDLSGSANPQVI